MCARCRGRRGAPSGEACGSSWRGELRGRVGLSRSLQRSVHWWSNRPAGLWSCCCEDEGIPRWEDDVAALVDAAGTDVLFSVVCEESETVLAEGSGGWV
jgi:hypothetical protein